MKNILFLFLLFSTSIVISQQQSYHDDAMRYFEINGTQKQYSKAIDEMFLLLKNQFSSYNIPDSVWDKLQKNKENSLLKIKSLLVSAYRSNFSHEELKELLAFYETPTGIQVANDVTKLTKEQKTEFAEFLTSTVGQKVQNQSQNLKNMVSEVSELWSRDLYKATLTRLKSEGYAVN